jgi:cysteine-rich repeat protein
MKNIYLRGIISRVLPFIIAFMSVMPNALAASFYFADNNNLRQNCPGEIDLMIDTEGQQAVAGDAVMSYNPAEATIESMSPNDDFPMNVFNEIAGGLLQFSTSRLPLSGAFSGISAFATISLTPDTNATSMTVDFTTTADGTESVIAQAGTHNNILTSATGKTYTINDRYNEDVNGIGWCNPDLVPPEVTLILPPNNSGGNPVDTDIVFSLQDNRTGVNISTLDYSIGGVDYTDTSPQTSYSESGGVYRVETNPTSDFDEGQNVPVEVYICDNNTEPAPNCRTWRGSFKIFVPPPPDPECGDGIVTYSAGEQCDDGNLIDGDGCSSLCLLEREIVEIEGEPVECPECPECPELPDECPTLEEQLQERAYEDVEIEEPIPGCTRADITKEIVDKFDLKELYADYDERCTEDLEHCMLPFLINTSYEGVDLEEGRYYPDVYTEGNEPDAVINGEEPIPQKFVDAVHFGTRIAMVQGYYEEPNSPFRPLENMNRIQIIKLLNFTLGQEWYYYDEYIARIGGPENLDNVEKNAADLNEWWYPRYYNFACERGLLPCDPTSFFGPKAACDPQWKRQVMADYFVEYRDAEQSGFDDNDNDGVINREENTVFYTNPEVKDTDDDGLEDGDEINEHFSNPKLVDTDYDQLPDGIEVTRYKTDPTKSDTDGDEVPDNIEIDKGTDPLDENDFPADANGNGIDDEWERRYGVETASGNDDSDNDGLSDLVEYRNGTDPTKADTDGDGITDADEVLIYASDPLTATDLAELGVRITMPRDGMTLTELRPTITGMTPAKNMEVEVILRNEFGNEVVLGTTLSDDTRIFEFVPDFDLRNGNFYLLAKGLDPENKQVIESPLVRVKMDTTVQIDEPQPERLSNVNITDEVLLEGLEVAVEDQKPVLIGRTGYKNRVVATWRSVLGTSAIVADLAGGEFMLDAPRELGYGKHTVSVFAVREADQAISKTVTVNFEIKEPIAQVLHGIALGEEVMMPRWAWVVIFFIGLGLLGLGFYLDRIIKKKK